MLLTITAIHRADLGPLPIEMYVATLDSGVLVLTRHRRGYRAWTTDAPDSEHVRHWFTPSEAEALWEMATSVGEATGLRMAIEVREERAA